MLDTHQRRRPMRVLAYFLLGFGALILMADPTQSLKATDVELRWVWSGLLLAGSAGAIYGAWRDRFGASLVGLIWVLMHRFNTGTAAFSCFLAAIVVIMASRWLDLWRLVGASTRAERRRRQ